MIKFLKFLFSKRPYKFLGRGGIQFTDGGFKYYVDTNNFLGDNNSVEIFFRDIKCLDSDINLSIQKKKTIADSLKLALQENGIEAFVV